MTESYVTHDDDIQDNFTMLSNALLRDDRMSLKARGLAAWLLSHKRGFQLSVDRIVQMHQEGKAAIRTALKELEEHGYLTREQLTDDCNRMTGVKYTIRQRPRRSEPLTDFPQTDYPPTENRYPYKKITSKKTTEKKTTPPGGQPSAAAPTKAGVTLASTPPNPGMEDPMSLDQGALFDAPPAPPREPGQDASAVVAAFVDSYRQCHGGEDPLKSDTKKVAGTAARLIKDGARFEVLKAAATAMGRTAFTDLAGQYRRHTATVTSTQHDPTKGVHRVKPHRQDADKWEKIAAEQPARNEEVRRHNEWLKTLNGGPAL